MPKQIIKFGLTVEYDPSENNGIPARIWLHKLINSINYEHPVKLVKYGEQEREMKRPQDVANLPLKKVDSIDWEDYVKATTPNLESNK